MNLLLLAGMSDFGLAVCDYHVQSATPHPVATISYSLPRLTPFPLPRTVYHTLPGCGYLVQSATRCQVAGT